MAQFRNAGKTHSLEATTPNHRAGYQQKRHVNPGAGWPARPVGPVFHSVRTATNCRSEISPVVSNFLMVGDEGALSTLDNALSQCLRFHIQPKDEAAGFV